MSGYKLPKRLKIEHTSFCNAQCIMCSHFFSCNKNAHMMNDELFSRIKLILPYIEKVLLHGSGEPLLHPNITEYIRTYASMNIEVTCNTNLSVMNEELAESIHDCFRKISISCDGSTAEIFEGIRKGLNFVEFIENLKLLRQKCPNLHIRMYTVVIRQNLEQLADIVRLAHKYGCNSIVMTDLNSKEILGNEQDMAACYPAAAKFFLKRAVDTATELGISLNYPEYFFELEEKRSLQEDIDIMSEIPLFPSDDNQKKLIAFYKTLDIDSHSVRADEKNFLQESGYHCKGICNYLLDEPYIDSQGNFFPCCANGQYNIGNIYENTFEEIWNNKFYQGMRKMFNEGKVPKYCKGCVYLRNHFIDDIIVLDMDDKFMEQQYNIDMKELREEFIKFREEME